MEFTNDIKFSNKPISGKNLKISYWGQLANSDEVYIVYGYGENWDYTSEQKMIKTHNSFSTEIEMKKYDTFNFCFRNSNYIWDNNNTFNYITPIEEDINTEESDSNLLDELFDDLIEEYGTSIIPKTQTVQNTEPTEQDIEQLFEQIFSYDIEEKTTQESFNELSNLFDEIITSKENSAENVSIDVGKELSNLFEKDSNFSEFDETQELNNTFSELVKNIYEIEEKTDNKIDELNYDYSDFNEMFNFAKTLDLNENYFDFSNLDFDFGLSDDNYFNFENTDFDFNIERTQTPEFVNNFSDSFYDDEDISAHDLSTNMQSIINNTVNELNSVSQASAADIYSEQDLNEYAQYFDNLIDEIVSTPTTSLSQSVSKEQIVEKEKEAVAIQTENADALEIQKIENEIELSTDGVPDEYALYDYKSHSTLYMIKRRFKLIFSTIFSKLPKIFGTNSKEENW